MSQKEKTGFRDASYSAWHRIDSIRRFVGIEDAQLLAMIDVDAALFIEYHDQSREPLVLIETARDVGQEYKTATVMRNLARRAEITAFVVLYTVGDLPNPAYPEHKDIAYFRVQRIWPEPATAWCLLSPQRWSETLLRIRREEAVKLDLDAKARQVIRTPSELRPTRRTFGEALDQCGNGERVSPLVNKIADG